ncbi:hypothetical protein KAI04_04405 [Candidatus Pacearchaeota archaeon]|nr:hypothetical protein [Candidatus Pacearchaeota archaeon]
MRDIFKLLFKEKPTLILLSLLNTNTPQNPSSLAKNISCTFCHVSNTLQSLEKSNLITFIKKGRTKSITLTNDGKQLAECLQNTNNFLKKIKT